MNILSYDYDINNLRINYKLKKKIVINNFLSNKFAEFLYKQINQLPQKSWFNCVGFENVKIEKRWKPENKKKHLMANELAKKSFCNNNFSYSFKRNMGMRPREISQSEKILRNLFSSEELYSIIEQITGDKTNEIFTIISFTI